MGELNFKSTVLTSKAEASYLVMDEGLPDEGLPYWKDYKANAVRGVIAALSCAAFFVIVGLVAKFRWRPSKEEVHVSYKRRDSEVVFAGCNPDVSKIGQENIAMDKSE